ncbi:unnamed protein product, partial [Protopolystoma xenopodis]
MKSLEYRIDELINLYLRGSSFMSDEAVSIEFLFDAIVCLFYECNLPQHKSERNCQRFSNTVRNCVKKIESCRLSRSEFDTIRLIGFGAFG